MVYLLLALALVPLSLCLANPQNPQVVSGEVAMEQQSAKLSVTASDKAIIHWKDFSIGEGETTQFVQPHRHATVLNRVTGELSSKILGTLEASGRVFLINPRGVLIGENARIDTGHFIASTLDLSDHDFASQKELLFKGDSDASILNLGTIHAWDGDVMLLARFVDNQGVINAPQGAIGLAGAQEILLKPMGTERIYIHSHNFSDALVSNAGEISALQVELKAEGNPYALAIKNSGKAHAMSVEEKKGRIFIVAEKGGINSSGSIATDGSEVKIVGNAVALGNEAGERGALFFESTSGGVVSIKAKEDLTIHDGFSIAESGGSLSLETAKGDINVYGSVKAESGEGIKAHAAQDMRIGSGNQTRHSRLDSEGPITIITGRDLLLTASDTRVAQISTQDPSGRISLSAGRDLILTGGKESSARAYIFSKGALSAVANQHVKLVSPGDGYAALGATRDVMVVVDNAFATPPFVGPGALTMESNTRMQGETLRIFTGKQSQNSIEGALNLVSFTPGAEFSTGGEEMWGTYFNSFTGGVPFTIFYKDVPVSPRISDLFIISTTEFLQDLKYFDDFFYVQRQFSLNYDRKAYAKHHQKAPLDRTYRMLRKTYRYTCGEIRELL